MEKLLTQMLEAAKKDKKSLIALKNLSVKSHQFELASKVRELEVELFPQTEEEKDAKQKAKDVNLIFRMVELNVSEDVCWLIHETIRLYSIMGKGFSLKDAAELVIKRKTLFDE